MSDPVIFTFAEIEFTLSASPQQAVAVRAQMRFPNSDEGRDVLAAGVASLLARDLCTTDGARVVPGPEVIAVAAALSTFTTRVEAIAWSGTTTTAWHVFCGPAASIALVPQGYGRFAVVPIDTSDSVAALAVRILETLVGGAESGLIVRATTGDETTGVAIAVDATGAWYVSDSVEHPDRGVAASRDAVIERIAAVLGSTPIGAVR
jgi:hypothetical protein